MNFGTTFGLEHIQRAAFYQIWDRLNWAIGVQEAAWAESDRALAEHMGIPHQAVEIERIAKDDPINFYEGHRPSLIKAPVEQYPNVSVWTVRGTANPESAASDHTNVWNILLFVEVMCKSLTDEGTVNKRIVRTAEAVNTVMQQDPTLGGVATGFTTDVTPNLSDVFTRRENTSYGSVWHWQGARLEYVVRKDSVLPNSAQESSLLDTTSSMPSGMTAADLALLDQS